MIKLVNKCARKDWRLLVLICLLLAVCLLSAGCGSTDAAAEESVAVESTGSDEYIDSASIDDEDSADYDKYDNAESDVSYDADSQQDEYLTDPVPEGKPEPVEWQDVTVDNSTSYHCTMYIECSTILDNMDDFNEDKMSVLPSDGVIYAKKTVTFYEGESVFDVLLRECKNNGIHMEYEMTPMYNSNYIEGIHNLYEFDCGELSGWMYCVNGWYPNYGCSRYQLEDGDVIEWHYTCDLGRDLGQYWIE